MASLIEARPIVTFSQNQSLQQGVAQCLKTALAAYMHLPAREAAPSRPLR